LPTDAPIESGWGLTPSPWSELDGRLAALDERPTLAAYQALARELAHVAPALRPARVAILSSFTIDQVLPFLRVEAARDGLCADVHVAPFNTVSQQLLDPQSGCARHRPDVVFVCVLLEDLCPRLAGDFLSLDREAADRLIDETVSSISSTLTAFRSHSTAIVVVSNFVVPATLLAGAADGGAGDSQADAIRRLNLRLAEAASAIPGVYIQDVDRLAAHVGQSRWYDSRMWALARAPLSAHALPALAASQSAFLRAALAPPRKCLVLDLDNTLWGGILGEDGLGGIKLGHTYPGNAFRAFQQHLLSLFRRGILLAINSKNNPADVDEVFRAHPDMVLAREHFSAVRVNWREKSANMIDIANELAIGLDALVFFDDSAVECALMKRALPEVLTIHAPKDVLSYAQTLARSHAFERLAITGDDRRRGEMYQAQAARRQELEASGSVDAFLDGLEMAADIRPLDQLTFARAVELSQKTNQFNLTTRRYTAPELAGVMRAADRGAFSLRLADRFGDNGVVGFAVVEGRGDVAAIDTFLLSCRVIGRRVETALLSFIADWARVRGFRTLEGDFIPTKKNAPAAGFFADHGFTRVGGSDTGASTWRLPLSTAGVPWPSCIRAVQPQVASA
jgi:FkbH-like protein